MYHFLHISGKVMAVPDAVVDAAGSPSAFFSSKGAQHWEQPRVVPPKGEEYYAPKIPVYGWSKD